MSQNNMAQEPSTEDWIKAGMIAAQTLQYGKKLIVKGATIKAVCDACDDYIKSKGAVPAFPSQVSCNHIAAHFCPDETDTQVFEDQLASLDVGACYNGAIGDNAVTVDLSGQYTDLIKASRDALNQVTKMAQIGTKLADIGKTVQETIQGYGYKPIRNLSGHGLGVYNIHSNPSIPNVPSGGNAVLEDGIKIAIEPFSTNGAGAIKEEPPATVFAYAQKKAVRSVYAKQALDIINSYKGLPFTSRWLIRDMGALKAKLALSELTRNSVIHAYPPLVEIQKGMVAQSEHTMIIADKPIITTKYNDE